MRARGFTLLEVLIAVAVIAIVAAVALPQYGRAVQRSYWRTARDLLQTIYSGGLRLRERSKVLYPPEERSSRQAM